MKRAAFSIILLAVLAHLCLAEIVGDIMTSQDFDRLYRAAVDIAMTCYGDPGNAVGVIGDTDGVILKALRLKSFIPVVLVNASRLPKNYSDPRESHELQVFLIAVHSQMQLLHSLYELRNNYIWWNNDAHVLLVDARAEVRDQCSSIDALLFATTMVSMLNSQFVCYLFHQRGSRIVIWNSNPFVPRAPDVWNYMGYSSIKIRTRVTNMFMFARLYREGGQSCESINIEKRRNVGGYQLNFITTLPPAYFERDRNYFETACKDLGPTRRTIAEWTWNLNRWFIENFVIAMNVTAVITDDHTDIQNEIVLIPAFMSNRDKESGHLSPSVLIRLNEMSLFAVTQHTGHKSQLEKILLVVDRICQIGVSLVYLITFLFFKFFLRQAVMPALLNIARLTCNTGLTKLPQNLAPTLYLTSLFMFVVTLQAIYTGNLSTLLTTTIPYPNVQTRQDIPRWGYKVYVHKNTLTKLTADPILDGCVIEIPPNHTCVEYILRDPLGVCVMDYAQAILTAEDFKLHVSNDPVLQEYTIYTTTINGLFQRRFEEIMSTLFETGLYRSEEVLETLRLQFVDDDEVKKNTVRRVMTLDDLGFAFVILGVGLLCALICFVGEIVICWIRLKCAKRRKRVHVRPAWGENAKKGSWFPSLNCRFNLRRSFSNRR